MLKPTSISSIAILLSIVASAMGCGSSVVVNIVDSDDDAGATGDNTAQYATVSSIAIATQVAAPDYTGADRIAVQIDAHDRVTTVTGDLDLTDGSVPAEDYVIHPGTLPASPTFAEVDSLFSAGTKIIMNRVIPGSGFLRVGDDLSAPLSRTAILHHEVSGVSSYQIFKITFHS
jgi:hypothetical protein